MYILDITSRDREICIPVFINHEDRDGTYMSTKTDGHRKKTRNLPLARYLRWGGHRKYTFQNLSLLMRQIFSILGPIKRDWVRSNMSQASGWHKPSQGTWQARNAFDLSGFIWLNGKLMTKNKPYLKCFVPLGLKLRGLRTFRIIYWVESIPDFEIARPRPNWQNN